MGGENCHRACRALGGALCDSQLSGTKPEHVVYRKSDSRGLGGALCDSIMNQDGDVVDRKKALILKLISVIHSSRNTIREANRDPMSSVLHIYDELLEMYKSGDWRSAIKLGEAFLTTKATTKVPNRLAHVPRSYWYWER